MSVSTCKVIQFLYMVNNSLKALSQKKKKSAQKSLCQKRKRKSKGSTEQCCSSCYLRVSKKKKKKILDLGFENSNSRPLSTFPKIDVSGPTAIHIDVIHSGLVQWIISYTLSEVGHFTRKKARERERGESSICNHHILHLQSRIRTHTYQRILILLAQF